MSFLVRVLVLEDQVFSFVMSLLVVLKYLSQHTFQQSSRRFMISWIRRSQNLCKLFKLALTSSMNVKICDKIVQSNLDNLLIRVSKNLPSLQTGGTAMHLPSRIFYNRLSY
jgi:hypothetical protein